MNTLSELSKAELSKISFLAQRERGNFIHGQVRAPRSGRYLPVIDPATEILIALAPDSDASDVDDAVNAARQAFESIAWSGLRPADRERLLFRLAELIESHADELSALETLQNGKLQAIARTVDVGAGAEFVRYMAGWATKLEGQTLQPSLGFPPGVKYHTYTQREPIGVVAAIVPWNFPLAIALWKIAPAIAAGCTVVLKPSPETPLTALRLAELALVAGFPPGILNVVCGGATAGAALAAHGDVNKISFTGSTPTGKAIAHAAVGHLTRSTLELGGKSPLIVLPDADINLVVAGAAMGIFFNQGQVCTAGSRLYVHRSIFTPVVNGLAKAAANLKLGSGFDPSSQMGPLSSKQHFDRVMSHIDSARQEGATLLTGGLRHGQNGYFVEPTVITNVRPDMRVMREEVFGPVICAIPFDELDEVVEQANDSAYGLAASIWSNNLSAVHRLIPRLRVGTVWVNCHNMLDNNMPLGGLKQSGWGKDLGRSAVESYTELKSVCMAI